MYVHVHVDLEVAKENDCSRQVVLCCFASLLLLLLLLLCYLKLIAFLSLIMSYHVNFLPPEFSAVSLSPETSSSRPIGHHSFPLYPAPHRQRAWIVKKNWLHWVGFEPTTRILGDTLTHWANAECRGFESRMRQLMKNDCFGWVALCCVVLCLSLIISSVYGTCTCTCTCVLFTFM